MTVYIRNIKTWSNLKDGVGIRWEVWRHYKLKQANRQETHLRAPEIVNHAI